MKKVLSGSLGLLLYGAILPLQASEGELRFSYWEDAKPPFIIEQEHTVQSGIIKDLADKLASAAGMSVTFVKLPVARIEPGLKAGSIDVDCLTSPIWKNSPDSYNWSPALLTGADRFLAQPQFASKLRSFDDLDGATLGIYNGYVYHPDIMKMIDSGRVATVKVRGLEHGIKLLKLKRLDALIDFGLLLKYQMKEKGLAEELALAELPADEFELHCAYSKKMTVNADHVNAIIFDMIKSGEIESIVNRYQ